MEYNTQKQFLKQLPLPYIMYAVKNSYLVFETMQEEIQMGQLQLYKLQESLYGFKRAPECCNAPVLSKSLLLLLYI